MKTILGYLLIIFSLFFIIIIAFPQFYSNNSSGRINKDIPLEFDFLKEEKSSIVLLFFGYVGCGDICPHSLRELSKIYEQLNKDKIKVYFVNVLDTANQNLLKPYTKRFHKDFKGIYLDKLSLRKVASKLNLALVKINDKEIGHTGHLYVLVKNMMIEKYQLKYIYTTRPFDEKSIVNDINALMQSRK